MSTKISTMKAKLRKFTCKCGRSVEAKPTARVYCAICGKAVK